MEEYVEKKDALLPNEQLGLLFPINVNYLNFLIRKVCINAYLLCECVDFS